MYSERERRKEYEKKEIENKHQHISKERKKKYMIKRKQVKTPVEVRYSAQRVREHIFLMCL